MKDLTDILNFYLKIYIPKEYFSFLLDKMIKSRYEIDTWTNIVRNESFVIYLSLYISMTVYNLSKGFALYFLRCLRQ